MKRVDCIFIFKTTPGCKGGGGGLHYLKAQQGGKWGKMQEQLRVTLQPTFPSFVLRSHRNAFSPAAPPSHYFGRLK